MGKKPIPMVLNVFYGGDMLAQEIVEHLSTEDYLAGELKSLVKHEFIHGETVAMAGASLNHNRLSGTLFRKFGNHLEKSSHISQQCEVFIADMKVHIAGHFFYPDILATCEEVTDSQQGYTESPLLIVEVLSKSTRKIDQTTKRVAYTNISTMQEYVLIEQDFVEIEVVRKTQGWQPSHYYLGDTIEFESLGLTLDVEKIYARVDNEDMRSLLR
jgi:Uma2 family endonuclease